MKKLLLILGLALAAFPLKAYDFSAENAQGVTIYYNIIDEFNCEVARPDLDPYSKSQITVPTIVRNAETDAELRVKGIGTEAFYNSSVSFISLPEHLEYIGQSAFMNSTCEWLVLPYTIKRIGNEAFRNARNLQQLDVEVDEPSDIELGSNVFENIVIGTCRVIVPKDSSSKYKGSPQWDALNISETAYYNFIEEDIAYYILNDELATCEISQHRTGGLTLDALNATIPETVEHRGKSYTPIWIGELAFEDRRFDALNLPNTITYIGNNAFKFAKFYGMVFTIPSSVREIGDYAFSGCNLTRLKCDNDNPENITLKTAVFNFDKQSCTLYVPEGSVELYRAADQWCEFENILNGDVKSVELSLTTLTLNEGESAQLVATVLPKLAYDPTLTWTSSNSAVVTVDKIGRVTAVSEGEATITATAHNGVSASCAVTVLKYSGIDSLVIDKDGRDTEVYTLQGVKVSAKDLVPGLYIRRTANSTDKVLVK